MKCPACGRCPFAGGVCEDRVNRGRRYFLMGALALPVARKLEALAPAPAFVGELYRRDGAGLWVRADQIVPGHEYVSFGGGTWKALAAGRREWL